MKYILLNTYFLVFTVASAQTNRYTLSSWNEAASTKINMLPMYGEKRKTEEQLKADKDFLKELNFGESHSGRRDRSNKAAESGWKNYYSGALDTAMFRFNQTWLIDSSNMAAYIGFAAVYATLGDKEITDKMFVRYKKLTRDSTLSAIRFQTIIKHNQDYFRQLEQQNYKVLTEYKPVEYYATGQLFIERKKTGRKYHYKWHHENGSLLREIDGEEYGSDWNNEIVSYHDNGKIAYKGKWKRTAFKPSVFTSYDRDGNVSQIEYWKKKPFSFHNYTLKKTVIYSQEIPWKKGTYAIISKTGFELDGNGSANIYPDGYIQEQYNGDDPLYKYYTIWKNGERGALIKTIPDDCTMSNKDGNFEWFKGKLYKLK